MADARPGQSGADCNLLYGMLALQMNFVSRDGVLAAMQAWVFDKSRPLGQVLQEQGLLTPERRQALDQLLAAHLQANDGDAHQSLAAVALPATLRDDLRSLGDADVQASLQAADPNATRRQVLSATPDGSRYRILRPHARGGLGEVWVALDEELHREVALKEISPRFAGDAECRGRFVQEAEITGGLEHPGIVPVYGLGAYPDGRPFYAMRFIQGETLKEAARKLHAGVPGVTLRGLLTRFVAVCNAIAYAHSRGVLHRDLKPANVMLGKYGETLVVDWGLAKAMGHELAASAGAGEAHHFDEETLRPHSGDSSTQTQMGSALGTPAYMSPEQAAGQLERIGRATDVYGLGATLYMVLTGRAPVENPDSAEVLQKVKQGDWRAPRLINKATPAALDAVCCKAMALKPEDRYPTALALAADVEAWLADEPVAAHAEPWTARALRWMRRRPKLVTAAAAVVIMAALGLGAGVLLLSAANDREHDLRLTAEGAQKTAEQKEEEARLQRDEARYNVYVADMNLAQRDWESGNAARVRELLDVCVPHQSTDRDLRGWEWYYQDRLCRSALRVITGHDGEIRCVAFHPDGSMIATGGVDRTLRLWDTASGAQRHRMRHPGEERVLCVAFSPDGSRVATGGDGNDLFIWDTASGAQVQRLVGHTAQVEAVAFSPDGTRLASGSGDSTIRIWDLADGRSLQTLKGHKGTVHGVAFAADGQRLASAGADGSARVWDLAGGEPRVFLGEAGLVRRAVFSPDGQRLAAAGEGPERAIRIWDLGTGRMVRMLRGHRHRILELAYGPDGTWLASCSEDGTVRVWDVLAGRELRNLKGHTGIVWGVACSRDGTRLVSAGHDATARLWDAAADPGPRALMGHHGDIYSIAFSANGARIASGGGDGTVRLWDLDGGMPRVFTGAQGFVQAVALSPDGAWLASGGTDMVLRLWDLAHGGQVKAIADHKGPIRGLAFSPDGTLLASACADGQVRLWDPVSGQLRHAFVAHNDRVLGVAFSRDGTRLASCSEDGNVCVWDLTGRKLHDFPGHYRRVHCVAFRPDGSQLATAGRDGTVRLWDLRGKQAPQILRGHTGWVSWLAYNPAGTRLATAGDDATVRLWDPDTGAELRVLREHARWVHCVAFSPDGSLLASAGQDGIIEVADARPPTPQREIEDEARGLVEALFARPLLKADVLAQLKAHKGVSEEVRRQALKLAGRYQDDAGRFTRACRDVVRHPDVEPGLLRRALGWAKTGCALTPDSGACLTSLGIAQYRLSQYAEALATLTRAEALTRADPHEHPVSLAFLTMVHHRLDHKTEAQAALAGLREVMGRPPASADAEALAFLAEAEALLGP
jgi:WD40 repeat protein